MGGSTGRRRSGSAGAALAGVLVVVGLAGAAAGPTVGAGDIAAPAAQPPPTTADPPPPPPPATLPEPESEDADPARLLLPWIVASPEVLATPDERRQLITATLEEPRNDIAVEDPPGTLCAVMRVPEPVMVAGRWERDGEPIGSFDLRRRSPPGFGACINTDDGEPFDEGVYQFGATGATGVRSSAATLVVGAARGPVWLLNDTAEPVCLVLMSPKPADLYEAFEVATPGPDDPNRLRPGEAMTIPVAIVEQQVQIYGCPPDKPLRTFELTPEPRVYVPMLHGSPATTEPTTPTTD